MDQGALPSAAAALAGRALEDGLECCRQYFWMTIAAGIFGFLMAFGIGANDVANAFATSVSAKSVSLKQAVLIAAVCEFLGATLLGASVTATIKGKIVHTELYDAEPDVLMYGMLTSLVSASFILMAANYLALPVSTTHTIVGSIVGFSLAAKGFRSVNWGQVGRVFVSWIAAPVVTGLFAALFFGLCRTFVLLSDEPYRRSVRLYPFIIFVAVGLDLWMVLYKAGKNDPQIREWGIAFQLPCAFAASLVLAVGFHFAASPCLQRRVAARVEGAESAGSTENEASSGGSSVEEAVPAVDDGEGGVGGGATAGGGGARPEAAEGGGRASRLRRAAGAAAKRLGDATVNRDIEAQAFAASPRAREIWDVGEEFDAHAEGMFSYLQVLTACLLSFAHGANDVANAIGPIATVVAVYADGTIGKENAVPKWIIFLGAVGIVVGLLLYGHKLMIPLGYKITKVSPSRGFCIELSASTVTVVASFLGIPVSTTQCQVGGTVGVGLLGGSSNLNPVFILKVVLGWVGTFLAVCIINAGVFAFAFYAPSARGFA